MSRRPDDGLHGADADGALGGRQPFWAQARVDGTALDVLVVLAHTLATRWVAHDLADRFGRSVATAAAAVLTGREGMFDLWEEPGRLVCHVVRGGAPDATAPQPDPRRLRLVTGPGTGIVVEHGADHVTVILPVPFE